LVNSNSSIVEYSINNSTLTIEGIITGSLLYFNENREINYLPVQVPYMVNVKNNFPDNICAIKLSTSPSSCKCKIKRGNTLIIDCELIINGCTYSMIQAQLIDNVKYNKPISYGDIAFQIYLAYPNETNWELCKRLHITREQLAEYNKENPDTYQGGEKIIVYR